MTKEEIDEKVRWTLHDLRRTSYSLTERSHVGIDFETRERMMGHKRKGVSKHYGHYDYFDEKLAGFKALADEIGRIVGGNVVEFNAA